MNISEAIKQLQQDKPIVVAGKTFEPTSVEELRLETGETLYWVRDGADVWLSLDPSSEEVILFDQIEVEFDPNEDSQVHNGEDFEFSTEGEGKLTEEDEELDTIMFRDYEGPDSRILRLAEYVVNSEIIASIGQKVPEEELQEV